MNRPIWLLPLVVFGAGLSIAGLAFLPFGRRSANYVPIEPPPPPSSPKKAESDPPTESATLVPIPDLNPQAPVDRLPPVSAISAPEQQQSSEQSDYDNHLDYLQRMSATNKDAGMKMKEIGALDRAVQLLEKASAYLKAASCMRDQQKRGVPFYDGKATCAAATSEL